MKVWIGKYRNHWISPYVIIDYVFFWTAWSKCSRKKEYVPTEDWVDHPEWVDRWADRLNPVSEWLQKFLDWIHPPVRYVKVDTWDTWSMDHTLAFIVVPMLKQLRDTKMGSPYVDDEDVPEYLRGSDDEKVHERWHWILDEMIFAFETRINENSDSIFYDHSGVDLQADINTQMRQMNTDYAGLKDFHDRVQNGFRLFGKYYQGLWD